jgi:hypothetical protein
MNGESLIVFTFAKQINAKNILAFEQIVNKLKIIFLWR